MHRIGRTGRAGATGEAISLVCVDEHEFLRDIERLIKRDDSADGRRRASSPIRSARAQPILQRQGRGQPAAGNGRGQPRNRGAQGDARHAPSNGKGRAAGHRRAFALQIPCRREPAWRAWRNRNRAHEPPCATHTRRQAAHGASIRQSQPLSGTPAPSRAATMCAGRSATSSTGSRARGSMATMKWPTSGRSVAGCNAGASQYMAWILRRSP